MAGGEKQFLSNKCAFAQVLTWGKLHCLPTTNCFARFQLKQQIATVIQSFHMACTLSYVKNIASLFGSSRMHQRGNWQVSAASEHLCLPHLNIALGIFLISLHKNFRNALRVWNFKLPQGILSFQLNRKVYQRLGLKVWCHRCRPTTILAHNCVLTPRETKA